MSDIERNDVNPDMESARKALRKWFTEDQISLFFGALVTTGYYTIVSTDELTRLRSLTTWRPVSEAPGAGNDHTILTYDPRNKDEFQIEMRLADGDWWRLMKCGPTHWLPLPPPPETKT